MPRLRTKSQKPKSTTRITHYQILGMPPASTSDQLHDRYLELAFVLHPDRGGDEEKFKAVTLAWGTLKNKEMRRIYDQRLVMEGVLNCIDCKGTGLKWTFAARKEVHCPACSGTGRKQ